MSGSPIDCRHWGRERIVSLQQIPVTLLMLTHIKEFGSDKLKQYSCIGVEIERYLKE
jgi:hypothetical protein